MNGGCFLSRRVLSRPSVSERVRNSPSFVPCETTRVFGSSHRTRIRERSPLFANPVQRSRDELFVEQLTDGFSESDLTTIEQKILELGRELDEEYKTLFSNKEVQLDDEVVTIEEMDAEKFSDLAKTRPRVMKGLLDQVSDQDSELWTLFQAKVQDLKLKRNQLEKELEELKNERIQKARDEVHGVNEHTLPIQDGDINIVLVTGFESFNTQLYSNVAKDISRQLEGVRMSVFNDQDIDRKSKTLEEALSGANVLFASLIVDYDQAMWLIERSEHIQTRFVFESALELMSLTKVGSFTMASSNKKKSQGAPPIVKKLLSLFGSKREEDRMLGYLSFLKIGPKILKFIPGSKAFDLQTWLMVYNYWTQGGSTNILNMVKYMTQRLKGGGGGGTQLPLEEPLETPNTGCIHPDYNGIFSSSKSYLKWYSENGVHRDDPSVPTVALLLYRKHVISKQEYINDMIRVFEEERLRPVPVFITGIEAHTVVRDQLTSETELNQIKNGLQARDSLSPDAIQVDAVVNTIGFPLVGGPAGSQEGGRQADIAQAILTMKNIPYFVAAPLLVQNLESWMRDGVAGLQSVVLYSLPELDGAVDTVPLGGLVGENIFLIRERVRKLTARVRNWVQLKKTPKKDRKIAVLLYGFPPGVGSIGTAALLNVPKSLQALLLALKNEGYDVGSLADEVDGELLIQSLKLQDDQGVIFRGVEGVESVGVGHAVSTGAKVAAAEVSPKELKELLTYPSSWGPSDWGPIPYLPDEDVLLKRLEKQWGDITRYRGISTSVKGNLLVSGIQFGNVWIGVQPLLGVEGDPMRLLFERDLTPHPQYIAFYKWLQEDFQADAVLHFGMHGTVEWLPGAPLGNTGLSWSDVLLGNMPNIYLYACNNPSESIIAKRRGYGTIISHNVPPYGRAGLYKQLAELKSLLDEAREDEKEVSKTLREAIVNLVAISGLTEDCPFIHTDYPDEFQLIVENVELVSDQAFRDYISDLYQYLMLLENRLYSEGLHVLGKLPNQSELEQYLEAYFGEELPLEAIAGVASCNGYQTPSSMPPEQISKLQEATEIRDLLLRNSDEMEGIMRALNGEYIQPAPGGDLLRDGAGVLPTGRNIFALDPYRIPAPSAMERGTIIANEILKQHLEENGSYPETVAVNLWGLDCIKTKGESVGIVLALVGARPLQEGTGRIARYELTPLSDLGGRPRIDCLCHMSGIFRDSFQNVVELLDDLFNRASETNEPMECNFIRKHAIEMNQDGLQGATSRLFSNPVGDFGSMVNERVGASDWSSSKELGSTWTSRNAFAYGRGEKGSARPEVLQSLLKTTSQVIQEIDSVEYGLTDIQEYYANTGALVRAIKDVRNDDLVSCSVVETFSDEIRPKKLDQILRMEYRTKLLNPKWAKAMAAQGSGGAYEISQRMTAMIGWGATTDFHEDWSWDQAANTYAFDPELSRILRESNPQAFRNVIRRMLEAHGRGFWKPNDEETIEQLREMYSDIEDELEGI
eukprot:g3220.t1